MTPTVRLIDMNRLIEVVADAVVAIDHSQRIVFFNAGAENVFGYYRDEVLGKPLEILLPERFAHVHAGHVQGFVESAATSRLMGQRQTIYARRKNGQEFRAEASISKITQDDDQLMVVLLRDITDRENMQAELRHNAEQLAVANERSRLARDLHDAVSQTLFSASLIADVLPRLWQRNPVEAQRRLEELKTLSRGALAEMRMLLLELRPSALIEAKFGDLLQQLGQATAGRSGIHVETSIDPQVRDLRLDGESQISLYRIAQEALNNIIKHSNAHHAWIKLGPCPVAAQSGQLYLEIKDDGRGFETQVTGHDHLGLRIMRERAQSTGATLSVHSTLGAGTEISVRLPGVLKPTQNK